MLLIHLVVNSNVHIKYVHLKYLNIYFTIDGNPESFGVLYYFNKDMFTFLCMYVLYGQICILISAYMRLFNHLYICVWKLESSVRCLPLASLLMVTKLGKHIKRYSLGNQTNKFHYSLSSE